MSDWFDSGQVGAEGSPSLVQWEDAAGVLHLLDADLVLTAADERTSEATEHAIETGATISDHVIQKPNRMVLQIAQTQTPIVAPDSRFAERPHQLEIRESEFRPGGLLALTSAARSFVSGLFGGAPGAIVVHTLSAETPVDRVNELHDELIDLQQRAQLITVAYRGRRHPDQLITRVTLTHEPPAGLGKFAVELIQIRSVATRAALGEDALPDPADLRITPAKKITKPKKPEDAPQKRESYLKKMGGLLLGDYL
jgi:hypothetical protein